MEDVLYGNHPQTVDDRYRVAVPAKLVPTFRKLAEATSEDTVGVVVTVTPVGSVGVFPEAVFKRMMEKLSNHKDQFKAKKLKRIYLKNREDQTLDKQNRFRIPVSLAKKYELSGEIMVMGSDDRLELASMAAWDKQLDSEVAEMELLHEELEGLEIEDEV